MNRPTIISCVSLLLAASGCAGYGKQVHKWGASAPLAVAEGPTQSSTQNQRDPAGGIVCDIEVPVGTHIPQRVCRDLQDVESDRMELQNRLSRLPIIQPPHK